MTTRRFLLARAAAGVAAALATPVLTAAARAAEAFAVAMSDADWRKTLNADQYAVLRESGTERPWSSPLLDEHRRGTFACAGCAQGAFPSATKFDSGTGWPSFWAPIEGAVATEDDESLGMSRTTVHCSRCGGHLGHVFPDGPKPTGLRYCMNGVALSFAPATA